MSQVIMNGKLQFSVPDSFHSMSEDELIGIRMSFNNGKELQLKAPELHMVISLAWKGSGGFFTKLFGGNDLVGNMESCYRKSFKQYGFKMDEYLKRTVAGETAEGLRYNYKAQGIEMTAESRVLEKDKILYYIHVYYRTQFSDECRKIWNTILDSAKWL